jgi:(S)-3,5-dihydroxyphenylglycine transaminase
MIILLLGLFEPGDALLVGDPSYIGITGLARIAGVPLAPVPAREHGLDPADVARVAGEVRRSGLRPRALYDVPDFSNPLGSRMPLETRRALLRVAREQELLIFEDNPYGMFCYDGERLPTLKALDEDRTVIYLGSFSKTLYPGLRVGFLVADQEVVGVGGHRTPLSQELSKVKSLTTVTSSPVAQAIVGALLLERQGSLSGLVEEKLPFYRGNRDRMLDCLERSLGGVEGVSWNRPDGGFFLTVDLPFAFGEEELRSCARDHGVIVCPMTFFVLTPGRERQIRLSFSYVTPEQIEEGIGRLARFVQARVLS